MFLQCVFVTFGAMMLVACAPTMVSDPPADHPASAQAATRELPVLTKLQAPAIAASQPSSQPASQPSSEPMDHSKHMMPAEEAPAATESEKKKKKPDPLAPKKMEPDQSGHDAHQHHQGGHQ
jgi:hypothetical protein